MTLRLPQAPLNYDRANENLLRSQMEEVLGYLYRSNQRLESAADIVTPWGSVEFIINPTTSEVIARITPLVNTLSFGYTNSATAFDGDRSHQTLVNFAGPTTPYELSYGVENPGTVRYLTVWFYSAAGGAGDVSGLPVSRRFDFTADLGPGTVSITKFASSLRPVRLGTSLPGSGDLVGDVFFNTTNFKMYRWTGSVWTAEVAAVDIVASWLTAGAISAGAINTNELHADAVTAGKVAAGQLTAAHLASNKLSSISDPTNQFIDFSATGTNPFIKHQALSVLGNGTATFRGVLQLKTPFGSVSQGVEFYDGSAMLTAQMYCDNFTTLWVGVETDPTGPSTFKYMQWRRGGGDGQAELYVDGNIIASGSVSSGGSGYVLKTGDTMTGGLTISAGGLSSTTGTFSGAVLVGASSGIGWSGRSILSSPADGSITLWNTANTDFSKLQFGGTSASFPALRRTGAALHVVLANESAFAAMQMAELTATSANLSGTLTGVAATFSGNVLPASDNAINLGSASFRWGEVRAVALIGALTGNATTATTLATARNINGVSFNGSADITVTAAAGTLTGSTLAAGVTASSLTSVGTLTSLSVTGRVTGAAAINAAGQLRATGWWVSGDSTGLGGELGVSAGEVYLYSYNRTSSLYGVLNFGGSSYVFQAGAITMNGALSTSGTVRSTSTYGWAIGDISSVGRIRYGAAAANAFDFITSGNANANVYANDFILA